MKHFKPNHKIVIKPNKFGDFGDTAKDERSKLSFAWLKSDAI